MAKVELIDYTGAGRANQEWHAADMLIFTKSTRLEMSPDLMRKIRGMKVEEKMEELKYMATTIPSSWEFISLTFIISGVSRACAQQMTRSRTGSYAMQSQRVTDASKMGVVNPFPKDCSDLHFAFEDAVEESKENYNHFVSMAAPKEDARGILPINTESNLVARYSFRSLVDLIKARRSKRTQAEYRDIITQMYEEVISAWPWARPFFVSSNDKAIEILENCIDEIGMETGKGTGWQIAKAVDLLRRS